MEAYVSSLKGESVDDLFAKQNQLGAQHTGNSPNPGFSLGGAQGEQSSKFDFPDASANQGNKQQFTFGANSGGFPDINFDDEFNLIAPTTLQKPSPVSNFPKPPEKAGTQTATASNFNDGPAKKPLNFGTITGLDLGKNKPPVSNTTQQPKQKQTSNYDAFDSITPEHHSSGGSGPGNFGMTLGGNSGMNSGNNTGNGFDLTFGGNGYNSGNTLGSSQNFGMGNTVNSQLLNTNELMSGFGSLGGNTGGGGAGMNLTFGHGMGGIGNSGGFKSSDDPFSRGMDGLMSSNNMGNMTFGANNFGGMGSFGGSSQGGMMDLGNFNSGGNMGSPMGMGNSFGGGMGQYSSQPQQKPPGGILSNPNLTFKNTKDSQKPSSNNFNEFDLL